MSSILLFSPVAVVRLIVGRLNVDICGDGGRKEGGICRGGSSFAAGSVGLGAVLGELEKGIEKRGRNFDLLSLLSCDSIWVGSFSDSSSTVVVGEGGEDERNGLSVRSGMVLV